MNARKLALVVATGLLLVLGACKTEVKADVACKGQKDGINCTVTETQGDAKAKVCWQINMPCKNGTTVTGKGCAEVAGGGKVEQLVPNADLAGDDKCDEATGMTLTDIKITNP